MDEFTPEPRTTDAPPARRAISRRASVIGTVVALAAIAAIAWLAWSLTHGDPSATPAQGRPGGPGGRGGPATTVGIATAERVDLPVIVEALGTVTPTATATVRPQVSGVLKTVHFREGQLVKAGQLLAEIDPRPFEMALMQASGQRMKDEAQLENAKLTLERYRQLLALDSIARQDVDTQAALVKQLEATVITSRAAEGTARLNLGYTRIAAPIGGRVGLRVVDVGNLVGSSDTQGIAVIAQLAPIDVEFAIPQDQLPELQARANEARLPVEALDRTRTNVLDRGTFASLDNVVDTQTGTVRAKARFPNAQGTLFPAQFVNVRLTLRSIAGAVVVPVTAVRHGGDGDFVYVLDTAARTVALRPVTRGQATVDRVQIATGLEAGEVVVTEGADRLKDGARVALPGDTPAAGAGGGAARAPGKGDGAARTRTRGDAATPDADGPRAGARTRGDGARSAARDTATTPPPPQ
jgi:multidrug efflux system membrane fusion protein